MVRANLWDRALQLELDRQAREAMNGLETVQQLLNTSAEEDLDTPFIPHDLLRNYRIWLQEFVTWEFTWDRLRFAAQRIYREGPLHDQALIEAEAFLADIPQSLESLFERMPRQRLQTYVGRVTELSLALAKEHLALH
jgi:hypothetical protein